MAAYDPDRHLIAGPTAFAVMRWRFRSATVTGGGSLAVAVLNASGMPQSWLTNTSVAAVFLSAVVLVVLMGRSDSRERAESKAGYTTLLRGDRELEQRDPYLGRVIRRPGDEYLPREEFLAILQTAKEEAERLAPNRR